MRIQYTILNLCTEGLDLNVDDTLLTFRDSLQIFISQIKKFSSIYVYEYYSDFDDFRTIRKHFEGTFEW